MGGGRNPSTRAEVLCRFSLGVCVTVIKKPLTPNHTIRTTDTKDTWPPDETENPSEA